MKKIYYLSTCSTCKKIMDSLDLTDFEKQDIKENPISKAELKTLKNLAGSYEKLFSRRAKLYKEMGLKDLELSEKDYEHYLLDHYTFLQRPVLVADNQIFIGSSPKTKKELIENFGK